MNFKFFIEQDLRTFMQNNGANYYLKMLISNDNKINTVDNQQDNLINLLKQELIKFNNTKLNFYKIKQKTFFKTENKNNLKIEIFGESNLSNLNEKLKIISNKINNNLKLNLIYVILNQIKIKNNYFKIYATITSV